MAMSLSRLDGTEVCTVDELTVRVAGRDLDELPTGYAPPARGGDTTTFHVPASAPIQRWDAYVLTITPELLLIITISEIDPPTAAGTKRVVASIEPESPTARGSLPPP